MLHLSASTTITRLVVSFTGRFKPSSVRFKAPTSSIIPGYFNLILCTMQLKTIPHWWAGCLSAVYLCKGLKLEEISKDHLVDPFSSEREIIHPSKSIARSPSIWWRGKVAEYISILTLNTFQICQTLSCLEWMTSTLLEPFFPPPTFYPFCMNFWSSFLDLLKCQEQNCT